MTQPDWPALAISLNETPLLGGWVHRLKKRWVIKREDRLLSSLRPLSPGQLPIRGGRFRDALGTMAALKWAREEVFAFSASLPSTA